MARRYDPPVAVALRATSVWAQWTTSPTLTTSMVSTLLTTAGTLLSWPLNLAHSRRTVRPCGPTLTGLCCAVMTGSPLTATRCSLSPPVTMPPPHGRKCMLRSSLRVLVHSTAWRALPSALRLMPRRSCLRPLTRTAQPALHAARPPSG